jgi:hypothetical protein
MKLYGKEIPADIEIPELSAEKQAELDTLHEEIKHHRAASALKAAQFPLPDSFFGIKTLPAKDLHYGVNIEGLRKLSPHLRAVFIYVHRKDITD